MNNAEAPTAKLKSMEIIGLFDMFDYFIEYPTDENVLLITGPNGFGKTQILNIIFHLFNRKFSFFQKLVFRKITVTLANANGDSKKIVITKSKVPPTDDAVKSLGSNQRVIFARDVFEMNLTSYDGDKKIEEIADESFNKSRSTEYAAMVARSLGLRRIAEDAWVPRNNHNIDRTLTADEILRNYALENPEDDEQSSKLPKNQKTIEILSSLGVHLIKEQRLLKKVVSRSSDEWIKTIEEYAKDLQKILKKYDEESATVTRELESTYPRRLVAETNRISREDYDTRFLKMKEKQDTLMKYGLYESSLEVLGYSQEDAKSLLVYLNDLEKKLGVFDDLIAKLDLFTEILNERRFTFKQIIIDREKGFHFRTDTNTKLDLTELSSGEQHEVVLLYELIFRTKPGILVLVDEPEISLHVKWQKEFLNDLLKIIDLQGFQVLVATHSPQIISGRWDLVYNLEKQEA
ncbi:MAG: AAA family ATPase [Ignavibacteria bacterium]|nr:AAA family ATPase [Ignavibacteria bacterium]